jgi:DNA polymerase-3 subunit delta'
LPPEQIEAVLAERRKDWKPKQRALVARLAEGAIGQALGFDLEGYLASRQDALVILYNATGEQEGARPQESDYGALFRVTETYRTGAEGQQKTSALLHSFASLLEDLLLLHSGAGHLIRNIDLVAELTRVSQIINVNWIESAVRGLDQVEQGMRRNLLRSLSLDSFAVGLSRA